MMGGHAGDGSCGVNAAVVVGVVVVAADVDEDAASATVVSGVEGVETRVCE